MGFRRNPRGALFYFARETMKSAFRTLRTRKVQKIKKEKKILIQERSNAEIYTKSLKNGHENRTESVEICEI